MTAGDSSAAIEIGCTRQSNLEACNFAARDEMQRQRDGSRAKQKQARRNAVRCGCGCSDSRDSDSDRQDNIRQDRRLREE